MSRRFALPLAVILAACSSSDNHSGNVSIKLAGPTSLRAVEFQVIGTGLTVSLPSGAAAHLYTTKGAGDTLDVVVVANQGTTLQAQPVSVAVPDTRTLPPVRLLQVAATDYSLPSVANYSLQVLGP